MLRRTLASVMVLATILGVSTGVRADAGAGDAQVDDATPPRLSYTTGAVSFWRPGGDDWAPAQLNTPLAEGDELYTGNDGNLELQVGGRAFVRAWGDTQVGLVNQDPNFVQLRVTAGHVALDLRALDAGSVVEVDTPGAAFTVDQPGYYRVDVSAERTSFSTRRSGRAAMTTATGPAPAIAPGEAVVVEDGAVRRLAAPDLDVWDKWNDARTASLATTPSAPYVPAQIYGASELDHYGSWRSDATYGSVWVPANVGADWAPYSTGRWIWDPRFGWTWLDAAPWGWAPYHYGRWVSLGGVWAWAPGPVVVRPVYAPALVAFFGTPIGGVQVAGPSIGWVALGWGEPVIPWWGRAGFVGRPWWGGWGGPRVQHVTVYRNVTVVNAVVAVRSDRFGRGAVQEARIARPDVRRLQPVRGRLDVKPDAASFRGANGRAQRPPDGEVTRHVVSTRPAAPRPEPLRGRDDRDNRDNRRAHPDPRHDQQPASRPDSRRDGRPNQGPDARRDGERDARTRPGPDVRRADDPSPAARPAPRVEPRRVDTPRVDAPRVQTPRPETPRIETPRAATPPRVETPERITPRAETPRPATPPRAETPQPATPRAEPRVEGPGAPTAPRVQAPQPTTPRLEPRGEAPRPVTPPRVDAPRVTPPPAQTPRVEPPRVQAPRPEPARVEPRQPVAPRVEPSRVNARRPEPPRADAPRMEMPRRAAAPGGVNRPEATRPAIQHRPEPTRATPPPRPQASPSERAHPGR